VKPPKAIVAASCQLNDVRNAIAKVKKDGDVVQVPAGEAAWTERLDIRVPFSFTLKADNPLIRDGVQTGSLINWQLAIGKTQRGSGFRFADGGRIKTNTDGVIAINGTNVQSTQFRFDHCVLDRLNGVGLRPNNVIGVSDHNHIITAAGMAQYIYTPNWNSPTLDHASNEPGFDRWGDRSWAAPVAWGSSEFFFTEDCIIDGSLQGRGMDGYRGTRAVFRYNRFIKCHVTVHGTESSGRNRGSRAVEIYGNQFENEDVMSNIRSGGALIWGNTGINMIQGGSAARLNQHRTVHAFSPFGGADGTSLWDINDDNLEPYMPTGPFTVMASGKFYVVADLGELNSVDLRGFTIRKLNVAPEERNTYSVISANESGKLTFKNNAGFTPPPLAFAVGDTFELRRVLQVLDGVGRGGGSLLAGGNPDTAPAIPAGWNDQSLFPVYEWLNQNNGVEIGCGVDGGAIGTVREGEHFIKGKPDGYAPYVYPHPLTLG